MVGKKPVRMGENSLKKRKMRHSLHFKAASANPLPEALDCGVEVACEDLRPISCRARRGEARVHEKGSKR
jgi:hypothetical protein